jgi:putative membrane protein
MTLFPPIGSDTAEFGYTANITDGVIPRASISALPVNPLESPSFKTAGESYKGGADTGVELTDGAGQIDENLLKLRDGAAELLAGLIQLRDGAVQLEAGLAGEAAPGAQRLASGASELAGGIGQIDDGAGRLAAGAGELSGGAGRLGDGIKKLDGGAGELNSGAKQLSAGTKKLAGGTGELNKGARKLDAGAKRLSAGAGELSAGLGQAGASAPALLDGLEQVQDGLLRVDGGLKTLSDGVAGVRANKDYQRLLGGLSDLVDGVGNKDNVGSLTWAVDQVRVGLATDAVGGIRRMQTAIQNNPLIDDETLPAGAYEKLGCAVRVLQDVQSGTVSALGGNGRAGEQDTCYFDEKTNPTATVPSMTGVASIEMPIDTAEEVQAATVAKLVSQLTEGQSGLFDPTSPLSENTLHGGLSILLDGLTHYDPTDPTKSGAIPALSAIECGLDKTSLDAVTCEAALGAKPGLRQGLGQVAAGVPTLVETIIGSVQAGVGGATDTAEDETLRGGINGLQDGVGQIQAGGETLLEGMSKLAEGAGQLDAGALELALGTGALSKGTGELNAGAKELNTGAGKLAAGVGVLKAGTGQLAAGSGELVNGAGQLADGARELAAGTGKAADGANQVSDGANQLSTGLGDAADGSGRLADGLGEAAKGAPKLRDGAQQLSDEGTSKLVDAGQSTAQNYGEMYATLEAGAQRAQDEDMVYGAPEGAIGLAAYSYEIKGEDGESGRNVARGLGGAAVLAAGAGAFALRRRFI